MAALTWRNVDLPNFDLRGLQVAGSGITDAFSRMGQMLIDRESTLRNDATKAATAKLMMASSPEELAALQNTSGLDKRVDLSTYASMLDGRRDTLQQRALTQEDLLNKQAAAMFGDEHAAMLSAAAKGDQGAIDAVRLKAEQDPLWGRVAGQYMDSVTKTLGETQTRMETSRHNQAGEATQRILAGNDSRRVSIAEQQRQEEHATYARGERNRRQQELGLEQGRKFFDGMAARSGGRFAGDAESLVVNQPLFRQASPTARQAILAGIKERAGEVLKDNSVNVNAPGAGAADNMSAGLAASSRLHGTYVNDQFTRNVPALMIAKTAAENPAYAKATIDDVKKKWETQSDIYNSADYIERLRAQGMTLPELMAMPDVIDMSDRSWDPALAAKTGLLSAAGGAAGGGLAGAAFGAVAGTALGGFDFTSGTNRTDNVVDAMLELRKPGNLAKAQNDLDARMNPAQVLESRMAALKTRAQVERQTNNQVSPSTLLQMRALQQQMDELVAADRSALLPPKR